LRTHTPPLTGTQVQHLKSRAPSTNTCGSRRWAYEDGICWSLCHLTITIQQQTQVSTHRR
ncbi:hypothetical protein NDU88_001749, partial [Pleurodeles waltl]